VEIPFASSPTSSLGVEWEIQLVDRSSRELVNAASPILAALAAKIGDEGPPRAKHELFESTIEVVTGVCATVGEATADLAATVALVRDLAAERGIGLMCAGTHPTAEYADQRISPLPRYQALVDRLQWLAHRLLIFGVHVHVGVRSPAKAIPIVNALSVYIPHFLALSASSPYWLGRDTGLASTRSTIFEILPTAGLPYPLADWNAFERLMETFIAAGTIETIREIWWDIRPHPDFGTVELRICDGLPTLREIGAVAALTQCLVERMDSQLDRGYTLPAPPRWLVAENKWRAIRHGLDAEIIVDGRGTTRPVRDDIADLVEDLLPVARRLGCAPELVRALTILETGASYQRQREVARAAGGALGPVVDTLLDEMDAGQPLTRTGGQ
jgi:glutamate---cysteine ligase / carboxylate-amine ligase